MPRSPTSSTNSRVSSDHDVKPSGSGERSSLSSLTSSDDGNGLELTAAEAVPLTHSHNIYDGPRKPGDDEENQISPVSGPDSKKKENQKVTWSSLPHKSQLAVLTLARLSEPLSERSSASYMYFQLAWFNPKLPEEKITSQGGIIIAAYAAAQFVTAVWWGRAADTAWIGRKRVILIGLLGTYVSTIGIGFSTTFLQALMWRLVAGALNGNIGVMRTMISEIIAEKKFQSRAFLLMPMCFNVGVIIGPIMGGTLADPIKAFPNVFGEHSVIGGKDGVGWMKAFPYALPNIVSGSFILMGFLAVLFGLDETHYARKDKVDWGRQAGKWISKWVCRKNQPDYEYAQVAGQDQDVVEIGAPLEEVESGIPLQEQRNNHRSHVYPRSVPDGLSTPPGSSSTTTTYPPSQIKPQLSTAATSETPLPNIPVLSNNIVTEPPPPAKSLIKTFPRNVILTLITHFILALHISTFNSLIFLLLPAAISDNKSARLPFFFTGGLGLPSAKVGLAMAIIGFVGLPMQLLLYPRLQARWGTLKSYKAFLPLSCVAYTFLPYLSLLPSLSGNKGSILLWPLLSVILTFQVMSRTFILPSMVILVNNSSPHPSSLGTIHGVAQSVSSGARTLGPIVGGWLLGWGLTRNFGGLVWWIMAALVVVHWVMLWSLREGS